MSDYYLGNGTKKPKLSDYRKVFGINAQMFYLVDKIRYETKREERKRYEETQKRLQNMRLLWVGESFHQQILKKRRNKSCHFLQTNKRDGP